MSARDRIKWNAIYSQHGRAAKEPAAFLVALDAVLPRRGRVLDVGGGSGHNGIWLARRGLDVTVVDVADAGLDLAAAYGRKAGVSLQTVQADLEVEPIPPGPWDVIIDFYFLMRSLFGQFTTALAPGGYLAFVQPTMTNLQRHTRPGAAYLLRDGELPGLVTTLAIRHYQEGWTEDGRCEAHLVARRPLC